MKHILFVCTGNTCRSPMAEHLLRHKAEDQFEIKSAGIAASRGQSVSIEVEQLFKQRGIDMTHQAQNVSLELVLWADLILTMTESHARMLKDQFPHKADIIFPLKAYVAKNADQGDQQDERETIDISDPIGGSLHVYEQTLQEMDKALDDLLKKV